MAASLVLGGTSAVAVPVRHEVLVVTFSLMPGCLGDGVMVRGLVRGGSGRPCNIKRQTCLSNCHK
jgi:hypothetical protein